MRLCRERGPVYRTRNSRSIQQVINHGITEQMKVEARKPGSAFVEREKVWWRGYGKRCSQPGQNYCEGFHSGRLLPLPSNFLTADAVGNRRIQLELADS